MSDIDAKFEPVTAADVTDERLVAGQLRAMQREMRDGFDSIGRALGALTRIEERLVVIIDRQNVLESRISRLEEAVFPVKRPTRAKRKK